jgi:hypothetical protein
VTNVRTTDELNNWIRVRSGRFAYESGRDDQPDEPAPPPAHAADAGAGTSGSTSRPIDMNEEIRNAFSGAGRNRWSN